MSVKAIEKASLSTLREIYMSDGCEPAVAAGQRLQDLRAHAFTFEDIDAQAAYFQGYNQHYEQLSAGRFHGAFKSYRFSGQLNVHLEYANRKLMQRASTPSGRCGFSIVAPKSPPCVFNGQVVHEGDIVVYPAGVTVEGTTPAGMKLYCVDIDAEQLAGFGFETSDIRIARAVDRAGELHQLIVSGADAFARLGTASDVVAAETDFCGTLADLVWQLAGADRPVPFRAGKRGKHLAFAVYHRARELMIEHLTNGVAIAAICRDIGVSRRTLECAFHIAVGMGPAQYVRKLQLNRVRRDLLCAANADLSIGYIAARHGVWHWSRFSRNYRMMFGELPSETRTRGRNLVSVCRHEQPV